MNKDLEQFENRSDDWLAKERKEESKVSAWDFDEGRRIKEYHEDHCDAREIKDTHARIHSAINTNQRQFQSQRATQKRKNGLSPFIAIIFAFVAFDIFGFAISDTDLLMFSPLIVIIIMCIFLSILSVKRRKKNDRTNY